MERKKKGSKWAPCSCGCKTHVLHPASSPIPTHGPKRRCWCCPPMLVAPRGADMSHSKGDEAVVSLDVPLEDLWARPQHTLKAGPVQLHTLQRTPGDDSGCPGTVQQQGDFPCRTKETWQSIVLSRQRNVSMCMICCFWKTLKQICVILMHSDNIKLTSCCESVFGKQQNDKKQQDELVKK